MTAPTCIPANALRLRRAFALRCPECCSGRIFHQWLQLERRCPRCALKLARAHPNHFVVAYLVKLIIGELLFAVGIGAWLLAVWPDVPWARIEVVAALAMIAAPVLTYPFQLTLWLAAYLILDPPQEGDR